MLVKPLRPSISKSHCYSLTVIVIVVIVNFFTAFCVAPQTATAINQQQYITQTQTTVLSSENFTFATNGSFIQIDAGRDWPFNSRREISFKFRTKSPHGLLLYQTFDHNKLSRDEQDALDLLASPLHQNVHQYQNQASSAEGRFVVPAYGGFYSRRSRRHSQAASSTSDSSSAGIAATASEKLVSSLFSTSPASAINSASASAAANGGGGGGGGGSLSGQLMPANRRHRPQPNVVGAGTSAGAGSSASHHSAGTQTVLSSTTISSLNAALYELYLKLENGRLKLVYEFGARLNQTYCGRGLNDDRWHRVELRVDPEASQMTLQLDGQLQVEVALFAGANSDSLSSLSSPSLPFIGPHVATAAEVDPSLPVLAAASRSPSNEFVLTNSVLYLGGLDLGANKMLRNVKPRLYMAQFIGCIGSILLKSDAALNFQSFAELSKQQAAPVPIERLVAVERGACINKCQKENFCLHKSTCINHYSHTTCDCFQSNHEDVYCWQKKLTTLSLAGHSTIVLRLYNWKDRHHSSSNRVALQFKTRAQNSILFFAYGDLSSSASQLLRPSAVAFNSAPVVSSIVAAPLTSATIPIGSTVQQPLKQQQTQQTTSIITTAPANNYLAVSLANGSLVVEVSFGDGQPVLLSTLLPASVNTRLADNKWHSVAIVHTQRSVSLQLDNTTTNFTITGKSVHLYFDPSVFVGGIPTLLANETRALLAPIDLRHRFVGCLRAVYVNSHDVLLGLKRRAPNVEFRDASGAPQFAPGVGVGTGSDAKNTSYKGCDTPPPASLPLTLRSGKSYLKFQLATGLGLVTPTATLDFEYRTPLADFFLAGGHLRDLSSHDVGGFWTLHARRFGCELSFTLAFGPSAEPEQLIKIGDSVADEGAGNGVAPNDNNSWQCKPNVWRRISITLAPGERSLNVTCSLMDDDVYKATSHTSKHPLRAAVELIHHVQLGGDLAMFGSELSSLPFAGCVRNVRINGREFDARELAAGAGFGAPPSGAITSITSPQSPSPQSQSLQSGQTADATGASSQAPAQGLVTLDSCRLVNPCNPQTNPCENNGTCRVNDLGEPECDCTRTGYVGRRCHFAAYRRSCDDLFLAGQRKSAYYLIDVDRNGPLRPIRVRCNMDVFGGGVGGGGGVGVGFDGGVETVLGHNLPADFLIRRTSAPSDSRLPMHAHVDVTYVAFQHLFTRDGFYAGFADADADDDARLDEEHRNYQQQSHPHQNQDAMLRALVGQAARCRQFLKFECRAAPLWLGARTWLEAPYPVRHRVNRLLAGSSLVNSTTGACPCAAGASGGKRCLKPTLACNCDANDHAWADDSTEFADAESVAITRVVLLDGRGLDSSTLSTSYDDNDSTNMHKVTDAETTADKSAPESQVRLTLSDLRCYGARRDTWSEITFKTSDAYLELPGWRKGDVSFSFRTASTPPVIILYQLATSRNHGYFRLSLLTDSRLLLEFVVNRKPRKLTLTSSHRLNNGEWQSVYIEYDAANLRLSVNDDSTLVDLEPLTDQLGTFEGPLFVGGAPVKYLAGEYARRNGFTGCFRALEIDSTPIDLTSFLAPSIMPAVQAGCRPSCTRATCQNGGTCIEYWGSYECECSNPFAHSGRNCEINLNTNSVTFMTQDSYYLQLTNDTTTATVAEAGDTHHQQSHQQQVSAVSSHSHSEQSNQQPYPAYLTKNILLSVRTYQQSALILYASDHLNNFIQLHKNGSSLVLTFNCNATIVSASVPIGSIAGLGGASDLQPVLVSPPISLSSQISASTNSSAPLLAPTNSTNNNNSSSSSNSALKSSSASSVSTTSSRQQQLSATSGSGAPIQVKIERQRLRTAFFVNNNFAIVEKPLILLTSYAQNPWHNPDQELVRPPRAKMGSKTFSQLFLANVDDYFTTKLPGFTGCIQGLSIDNELLDFNRAHLNGEWKGDYKIGCKMHCDTFPCKNRGICIENWRQDSIQCKCDATSYVGRLCDEDVAAIFDGHSSRLVYNLSRRLNDALNSAVNDYTEDAQDIANTTTTNLNRTSSSSSKMDIGDNVNYFELSLAFSTTPGDSLQQLQSAAASDQQQYQNHQKQQQNQNHHQQSVQVLFLLTRANASKHFLLGLTRDGSLLVEEDFGGSMTLSRFIKRAEFSFNDGFRHFVKYARLNQTIQISVDYQSYLPSMNVAGGVGATSSNASTLATSAVRGGDQSTNNAQNNGAAGDKMAAATLSSLILIGTASDEHVSLASSIHERAGVSNLTHYSGCISNVIVKLDGYILEPLSETFGQNIDTHTSSVVGGNANVTSTTTQLRNNDKTFGGASHQDQQQAAAAAAETMIAQQQQQQQQELVTNRLAQIRASADADVELIRPIRARNVEQGKCASFRKLIESGADRKSLNEPKSNKHILDPKPVYMDPPRIKPYKLPSSLRVQAERAAHRKQSSLDVKFYLSLSVLLAVIIGVSVYAYMLQVRYKAEKFRCETPFFHKRANRSNQRKGSKEKDLK